MTSFSNVRFAIVLGLLILHINASPVLAQDTESSQADLRKMNQQLLNQVQDLERDLTLALERNRQLEAAIARLEQQLATAPAPVPPPRDTVKTTRTSGGPLLEPEDVSIDESVPHASPRALFKAVVASYEKNMADIDWGGPGLSEWLSTADERKRRGYLKRLETWRAAVNREFRGPIEWYVRVVDARRGPNDERIVTLIPVDPVTGTQLGNQFDVALSQTLVDRLARYESLGQLGPLVLRGTLVPMVRIDATRETRGSFDNPPFIGPFAEFVFRIDVSSLQLAKDDLSEPGPQPAGKPAPSQTPPSVKDVREKNPG